MTPFYSKETHGGVTGQWLNLGTIILDKLADGFVCVGNLNLDGWEGPLPSGLVVLGSMYLGNYKLTEFPQDLFIKDYLIVNDDFTLTDFEREDIVIGAVRKPIGQNAYKIIYNLKDHLKKGKHDRFYYCDDDSIVYYDTSKHVQRRREDHFYIKPSFDVFYCSKDIHNVVLPYKRKIFIHAHSVREAEKKLELYRLKERAEELSKYKTWTVEEQHTVDELKEAFKDITEACEQGCEKFIKEKINREKTYSINELMQILTDQDFSYVYLFRTFFYGE